MNSFIVWSLETIGFEDVKPEERDTLLKCFKAFIVELNGKTV